MKIVHLGKYYYPAAGGIETHLRTMAIAQAANGHEVEVHCFHHNPAGDSETFNDQGVTVFRYSTPGSFGQLTFCPSLTKNISRSDGDLFHVQVPNPSMILALLSSRPTGVPIVVTYQSDHVNQPVRGALFRPFELLFYAEVDRIIATSQTYRESSPLLRRFHKKVKVVPLGIPTDSWFNPTEAQRNEAAMVREQFAPDRPLWVTCSRLVPYKGIRYAIEAMRETDGKLLVLGDGPERDRLAALRNRLGLQPKVWFTGFVPDLVPYLMAATALWLPSFNRAEAFGIIQIEAMAAGCPVINCLIPGSGVASVSVDGLTGFTVPTKNASALATAATRLAADDTLRARFSAQAVDRVKRLFSLPVCLAQVQEIYDDVVARSRRSHAHVHRIIRKTSEMKTSISKKA